MERAIVLDRTRKDKGIPDHTFHSGSMKNSLVYAIRSELSPYSLTIKLVSFNRKILLFEGDTVSVSRHSRLPTK